MARIESSTGGTIGFSHVGRIFLNGKPNTETAPTEGKIALEQLTWARTSFCTGDLDSSASKVKLDFQRQRFIPGFVHFPPEIKGLLKKREHETKTWAVHSWLTVHARENDKTGLGMKKETSANAFPMH